MFVCNRCGSSYSARHIGVEHCPRCRVRDKVQSPLAFKAFDLSAIKRVDLKAPGQLGADPSPEIHKATG
jgi:hypothetical protein